MWFAFFFQYYPRYKEFRSDFNHFGFILQNWNLNKIFTIFGNIDSTIKADDILEKPGLGEFCGYCFKSALATHLSWDTLYFFLQF